MEMNHQRRQSTPRSYPLVLIGLKAVHVVGAPDAPGTQEFQQVDFHGGLHKNEVVV